MESLLIVCVDEWHEKRQDSGLVRGRALIFHSLLKSSQFFEVDPYQKQSSYSNARSSVTAINYYTLTRSPAHTLPQQIFHLERGSFKLWRFASYSTHYHWVFGLPIYAFVMFNFFLINYSHIKFEAPLQICLFLDPGNSSCMWWQGFNFLSTTNIDCVSEKVR